MKRIRTASIWLLWVGLAVGLVACAPGAANSAATRPEAAGDPIAGQELFASKCGACHGPEGAGLPGLGKPVTNSAFIAGKTDIELVEFIKQGRAPGDPLNTTGVAMPPKGGNPTLDDQNLLDIVAYLRALQD
ncbi:MAG: cytochrome c [Chloroflexota bacterium]